MVCKAVLLLSLVLPLWMHERFTTSRRAHTAVAPCRASALRATPDQIEGAAGSVGGNVLFTNRGSSTCRLYGVPRVQLYDRSHRHLPVRFLPVHLNMLNQTPHPVYVRVHQQAGISVSWSHYCYPTVHAPVFMVIQLPQRGGTNTTNTGPTDRRQQVSPPCYGLKSPSVIRVWAFTRYPLIIPTPPPQSGLRVLHHVTANS